MVMEISGNNNRPPQGPLESTRSQTSATPGNTARGGAASRPTGGTDQFDKSDQVLQLQALQAEIANLPVVDVQRVQEVQQTLATGAFEFHAGQVADKLLTFEAGFSRPG